MCKIFVYFLLIVICNSSLSTINIFLWPHQFSHVLVLVFRYHNNFRVFTLNESTKAGMYNIPGAEMGGSANVQKSKFIKSINQDPHSIDISILKKKCNFSNF